MYKVSYRPGHLNFEQLIVDFTTKSKCFRHPKVTGTRSDYSPRAEGNGGPTGIHLQELGTWGTNPR